MKKSILTCVLTALVITSCFSQQNSEVYSSCNKGSHSVVISDDEAGFELKYSGDIKFNDDETAIGSISKNGFVKYKRNGTRISVDADESGNLRYVINGGARKAALDITEMKIMTEVVKTMIAYGAGAADRVKKIYQQSGSKAVLNEIGNLKTDFARGVYLEFLLNTNNLQEAEAIEIVNKTGTLLQSDFEKAGLLKKFPSKYLSSTQAAQAYLNAVAAINSDFEKAGTLKSILDGDISADNFTRVIKLAGTIDSDFEKAGVLKSVLDKTSLSAEQFSEVVRSVSTINSDFEKANVIKEALGRNALPQERFDETLAVIGSISSDFEKAGVLKLVAGRDVKSEQQWLTIINCTTKISSDFEKADVMVDIARKMPVSDKLRTAFNEAAKSISSDFEYGRVVRSVK